MSLEPRLKLRATSRLVACLWGSLAHLLLLEALLVLHKRTGVVDASSIDTTVLSA